jgi:Pilus assembly protein, PilO
VSLTDRDRKIMIGLAPILVLLAYWFLLLAPKREAASTAGAELSKQEQRLDTAKARSAQLGGAKTDFAADYEEMVRLGKALPTAVDMPTVIVQLEAAAKGTGIRFTRIATGERDESQAAATTAPPAAPGKGDGSQPAAAGGEAAGSAPGKAAETAGNAVNNANSASQDKAAAQSGVSGSDTQTSQTAKDGGLPVGGGSAPAAGGSAAAGSGAPGLDSVPLELEFQGQFFDLADFFHRLKRFVKLANDRIEVRGRLLSVEGLKFSSDPEIFPRLKAELKATIYLAPKTQGATNGASPQGPAQAQPASGSAPADAGGATPPPVPTATAAP